MGYETSYLFVNMGGSLLFLMLGGLAYLLVLVLATRRYAQSETKCVKLQQVLQLNYLLDKFLFNRLVVFWDGI